MYIHVQLLLCSIKQFLRTSSTHHRRHFMILVLTFFFIISPILVHTCMYYITLRMYSQKAGIAHETLHLRLSATFSYFFFLFSSSLQTDLRNQTFSSDTQPARIFLFHLYILYCWFFPKTDWDRVLQGYSSKANASRLSRSLTFSTVFH